MINLEQYEVEENKYKIPGISVREAKVFTQPDQDIESEGELVLDGKVIGTYIMTDKGSNIIGDFKIQTTPSTITHHVQEFNTNQSVASFTLEIFQNENGEWDADVPDFSTGIKNSSLERMKNEDKKIDRVPLDADPDADIKDHVITEIESVTI